METSHLSGAPLCPAWWRETHHNGMCAPAGRDKVQRSLLSVHEGPSDEQVTGLAFRGVLVSHSCPAPAPAPALSGAWLHVVGSGEHSA